MFERFAVFDRIRIVQRLRVKSIIAVVKLSVKSIILVVKLGIITFKVTL
jgi:hypothetical protein